MAALGVGGGASAWGQADAASTPAQTDPASQTRAGEIQTQEQEKAKHLTPLVPPKGEAKFDSIEKTFIDPLINPNGFSPKLGGLPTGGGFSLGPRYTRQDLMNEHLLLDTSIVGSTKEWYRGDASLTFRHLFNDHLTIKPDAAYENAASVYYFGEGPFSSDNNKSDFRREFTTAHLDTTAHLAGQKLQAGYTIGGLLVNVGAGQKTSDGFVSSDTIFTEANTPGLEHQTNFITSTVHVGLDLTQPSFSNVKGLRLEASDSQFFDQGDTHNSFHLLDTQATYSLPFLNGMRAVVFHLHNESTFHSDGQVVPFYLQPTIGGPNDLRGYDRYRFYDENASTANAEYRWPVSQTLEFAVFGDGGNVYGRPGLIGLRDARGDGGFGVRFKAKDQTVIRFDVGISPEGVKVWFVFNGIFAPLAHSF
ncbi:hypothetical protein [Silvibacterium sp.]|uniref:hypothetical protein n=1 Tax=Silvibacterium sp. TaxID=1964179 RepID=UPI0039E50234